MAMQKCLMRSAAPSLARDSMPLFWRGDDIARSRRAKVYGEVVKGSDMGESSDQYFRLEASGERWADVVREAVDDDEVALIYAHGCGDPDIDRAESCRLSLCIWLVSARNTGNIDKGGGRLRVFECRGCPNGRSATHLLNRASSAHGLLPSA